MFELNENIISDETTYFLNKTITDGYEMEKTKENVTKLLDDYKKAKFQCFASKKALQNITVAYEPKYSQNTQKSTDKIGNNIGLKLDSENVIKYFDEIFTLLLKKMNSDEIKYYNYCLAENNSEQVVANVLGISRTGLQPIKNSCILKIALAFHIDIPKGSN